MGSSPYQRRAHRHQLLTMLGLLTSISFFFTLTCSRPSNGTKYAIREMWGLSLSFFDPKKLEWMRPQSGIRVLPRKATIEWPSVEREEWLSKNKNLGAFIFTLSILIACPCLATWWLLSCSVLEGMEFVIAIYLYTKKEDYTLKTDYVFTSGNGLR